MTPAYDAYLAPARSTSQPIRLAVGLGLILAVYTAWMTLLGALLGLFAVRGQIVAWAQGGDSGWMATALDILSERLDWIGAGADPWALIWLLASFLGGWFGVSLAMRILHRRRGRDLLGRAPVVLRDFALGAGMMAVLGGAMGLVLIPALPRIDLATEPRVWLMFLPLALVGILIQAGAEELVFRGYLQGQLAARFASPLVWLGVPTAVFGFAHFAPGAMGANTWLVVFAAGVFGLVVSDLTARTGSLGLAWGLHFANNVLALLVISVTGGLSGLALFSVPQGPEMAALLRPLILADIAVLVIVWMACRLWLRRR
tara:strand:- start:2336 stop:3280 length:945 start_codon:yes stop_codon:yes gene_type:complete